MRVKYSVIPFVPAFIVMLFFKLMSLFGLDGNGNFMGMNAMNITYTVIGICVGLFVVCVILNIFDRKTSPVYPVKKNVPAGVLSLLSGALIIAGSAARLSSAITGAAESENLMMYIICAVFSLPAGIALMLISKIHFQGKSVVSNISMLFVAPALWGCAQLVTEFLMATKASIYSRDLSSMFCYIFLTLYLFSNSMIVSRIKGRNPVKSCFIYGLPAVAISVTFGVYEIMRLSKEGYDYASLLSAVQFIALGLYAVSFIMEMFLNSYTKDEFEIVDALPPDEKEIMRAVSKNKPTDDDLKIVHQAETEEEYINTKEYEDLVFSDRNPEDEILEEMEGDTAKHPANIDDFVIGYSVDDYEEEPIPYFTEHEKQNTSTPITLPYNDDDIAFVPSEKTQKKQNAAEALKNLEKAKAADKKLSKSEKARKAAEKADKKRTADNAQKAKEALDEQVVAVNNDYDKKSASDAKKDDDYYERRLQEINDLLMGIDKQ